VRKVITEELTEKQRQAMIAVTVRGAPLEEVARRMGMNRNALYKLLHDARLNLKRRLASEGLEVEDIFSTFANQ
jgi:RNA polymerase sigma-70 factor (ECF subfamily)